MKIFAIISGVYSGCGKGVAAASLLYLMKCRGHTKIAYEKFDPYFNASASSLRASAHGEVFVGLNGPNGGPIESDLDLGTIYRIAGIEGKIYTSGVIFKELIEEEENGVYLGQTVQMQHIVDKIKSKIEDLAKDVDVCAIEIGGSLGDYEQQPYVLALKELREKYHNDCVIVLVAPVIYSSVLDEHKSKPLQLAVKTAKDSLGAVDMLLCRTEKEMSVEMVDKISKTTNVNKDSIVQAVDVDTVYKVVLEFYNRNADDILSAKLGFKRSPCRINQYRQILDNYFNKENKKTVTIGIVGKYETQDSYLSVKESLFHAAVANSVVVDIKWIQSAEVESSKSLKKIFNNLDGIVIPGGFGSTSVEGKIKAAKYCLDEKVLPCLGICYGLQIQAVCISRYLCGLENANSQEFDEDTTCPIVHYLPGQKGIIKKSGTMRLGAYDCQIKKDTLAYKLYNKELVSERHRHRLEINPKFLEDFEKVGFIVSGTNPQTGLIEMMELKDHPFFIGHQAHAEFNSRLSSPAPLFVGLVSAAVQYKLNAKNEEKEPELIAAKVVNKGVAT